MPSRCCVPQCKSNYDSSTEKVSVFRFPNEDEILQKWIRIIPRKDFKPTKSSRVCQLHFIETDIERETYAYDSRTGKKITAPLSNPRLKRDAVPSVFPGCPTYLSRTASARETPEEKRERLENEQLQAALKLSEDCKIAEEKKTKFSSYDAFVNLLEGVVITPYWTKIITEKCVIFAHINYEGPPSILTSVVLTDSLELKVFFKTVELKILNEIKLPKKTNCLNELTNVLEYIESLENNNKSESDYVHILNDLIHSYLDKIGEDFSYLVNFFKEQISLVTVKKEQRRYSSDTMIFSTLLFSISPHAYRFILKSGNIVLPHPSTIRRITGSLKCSPIHEQSEANFLKYTKEKSKLLDTNDKTVVVMMDEIHLKPYLDYKGGNIVGMSYDDKQAATSAYTFMIQGIISSYKEVVHILPVRIISGETLHVVLKKIIIGLEEIGFFVIAVISDNNSVNGKAMSFFISPPMLKTIYPHPVNPNRPLFFVIDAVHILKCIRNNWLNQHNQDKCMFYPNFDSVSSDSIDKDKLNVASFSTIRKLHELEHVNIVKFGYGLTLKALNPTNLERQNVKLALQIFNEFVVKALLELGEKHNLKYYADTSSYIQLILQWWWTVNVKTPNKGIRLRNIYMQPLTSSDCDERRIFLSKFISWLDRWGQCCNATGRLTKETHTALTHTSKALLELSSYCTDKLGLRYILTGKFQTDTLEERFGKYRMLCGSQYNVSVRQIFEAESKLRLQNYLPLTLESSKLGKVSISNFDIEIEAEESLACDIEKIGITVEDSDFEGIGESLPVLVYMAGYCVYTICKNLKCDACRQQLVMERELAVDDCYNLIVSLNRGGLQVPNAEVIGVVTISYIVALKLLSSDHETYFIRVSNQRRFMSQLIMSLITNFEIFNDSDDVCSFGHVAEDIVRRIIWVVTNILLKNYCGKNNDVIKKIPKKRKLQTLEKK